MSCSQALVFLSKNSVASRLGCELIDNKITVRCYSMPDGMAWHACCWSEVVRVVYTLTGANVVGL